MWNIGDTALCIHNGKWINQDGLEINPSPKVFGQYIVDKVEYHEFNGNTLEYIHFNEFTHAWLSIYFIKADDPESISDDNAYIPIRIDDLVIKYD